MKDKPMDTQELIIKHPEKQGFIMLSHELKTIFRKFFNLDSQVTVHGPDILEISFRGKRIHHSKPDSPDSVDIPGIVTSLADQVRPVRAINPADLHDNKLQEKDIEEEWRHALCSGE